MQCMWRCAEGVGVCRLIVKSFWVGWGGVGVYCSVSLLVGSQPRPCLGTVPDLYPVVSHMTCTLNPP